MHPIKMLVPAVALATILAPPASAEPAPPAKPFADFAGASLSAAECEVWDRERGFAESIHSHDPRQVAGFIAPGAVFGAGSNRPVRGRDAVLAEWATIIEGKEVDFHWSPGATTIGADPDLAVSSGPVWFRPVADGKPQGWRIGRFSSVWHRDADGQWRVAFDGAGERSRPASDEDVAALLAAIPASCPQAP